MNLFGKTVRPIVVRISLILLLISNMFPPFICVSKLVEEGWKDSFREWGFIFMAPHCDYNFDRIMEIDIRTLAVEYILIIILGCLIHMFIKKNDT